MENNQSSTQVAKAETADGVDKAQDQNVNGSSSKESGSRSSRRDRDQSRRRRRSRSPTRSREDRSNKVLRRVYVANIPFDVKWGELKDLFREKVGNVRFCQLFENEEGKPRGCGLVEFDDSSYAKKAIEVLNRYNFKGRELVVKEDLDLERDRYGRLLLSSRNRGFDDRRRERYDEMYSNGSDSSSGQYNTYGLSPQFLASLGIKGALNNRVFVANLDYKVSERKLEDIFALAGKVTKIRLYCDNEGKSKGFGVVEFEHPIEAVQAISMFNNQKLFDRVLSVRLDKFDNEDPFGNDGLPAKLPKGLESIGKGLGIGGQPLNVAKGVPAAAPINPIAGVPAATQAPIGVGITPQTANVTPQAATAALNVLTNLAGLHNLPTLTQSLAQLSSTTPAAGTTLPPTAAPSAYSTTSDLSTAAPATTAYAGYSSVVPQGNGTTQPAAYSTGMPAASSYGHPSSVASGISYSTTPSGTSTAPISSYSTYDQREYAADTKYRTSGIDTIFVRNLPPNFSWQNLRDRFNEVGEVRFAEIKGHGTALVRFGSDRDAQRAVDLMNGIRIENRAIEVSLYY